MALTLYNLHSLDNNIQKASSFQKYVCNWNLIVIKHFAKLRYTRRCIPTVFWIQDIFKCSGTTVPLLKAAWLNTFLSTRRLSPLHAGKFLASNDCRMPANKAKCFHIATLGWEWGHGDLKHVEMLSRSLSLNPGKGKLAEPSQLCKDTADLGRDPSPGMCRKPKLNARF